MMGIAPAALADFALTLPAAPVAVGGNCGVGASDLLVSVLGMTGKHPEAIVIAKANCGIPVMDGGHVHYSGTDRDDGGVRPPRHRRRRPHHRRLLRHLAGAPRRHAAGHRRPREVGPPDRRRDRRARRPAGRAVPEGETATGRAREGRRGREARRAERLKGRAASIPYITRNIPLYEISRPRGSRSSSTTPR
jgi:hypothetical protein